MPESNHVGIDEAKAAKVVLGKIREAAREMANLANEYAARGEQFDASVLGELNRALEEIADQFAIDLTKSDWGREIIAAAKKGGRAVPGLVFTLSKDQIQTALFNAKVKVKGLLGEGIQVLNQIITGASFGKDLREIAKQIRLRVTVGGGIISEARADMIARDELFSTYRQTSKAAADAEGLTLFQMRGPLDIRTTAICARHIGQVKTAEEWKKIAPLVFTYGLHYQ